MYGHRVPSRQLRCLWKAERSGAQRDALHNVQLSILIRGRVIMTTGTRALFANTGRLPEGIIYPDLLHAGMHEMLEQNADAFNAASMDAIAPAMALLRAFMVFEPLDLVSVEFG